MEIPGLKVISFARVVFVAVAFRILSVCCACEANSIYVALIAHAPIYALIYNFLCKFSAGIMPNMQILN